MRIFTILCLMATCWPACAQEKETKSEEVRGMTISCPGSGRLWGSDAMVETMRDLKKMGVNWITIHPYGGIRNNGLVASRLTGVEEAPSWISRPIREAHKLGLKVLMKPHIAYWGSKFSWRGEIEFTKKEDLDRFYSSYEDWIVTLARMSKGADAFVIGTELDRFVGHKSRWQKIIKAVRGEYTGALTYAANWTDFEQVTFWQDLDVVGIQAYFPILSASTTPKLTPTQANIRLGWQAITEKMRRFHKQTGKKICFTELGYNRSSKAPFEPWDYATGGQDAEALQKLCLREALKAIAAEPAIVGSFLWKCFPGKRQPRNFNMHSKAMRDTIQAQWQRKKKAKDA